MFWVNQRKGKRTKGVGMIDVFMQENFFQVFNYPEQCVKFPKNWSFGWIIA